MASGIIIGIGCGLASAVLAYSAARGSVGLKLLLFILMPLPLLIGGFGWGLAAAIAGAVAGTLIMMLAGGPGLGLAFLLVLGLPAIGAAWLAELGRKHTDGTVDWLPIGTLLAVIATYAGLMPLFLAPAVDGDFGTLRPRLLPEVTRQMRDMQEVMKSPPVSAAQIDALVDMMIRLMPAMLAAYWVVLFTVNLYLAGRVARASGRLVRPWPDLHALMPPAWLLLVFVAGLLLSYTAGALKLLGGGLTGGLLAAFVLFGLSVLHAIAKGRVPWVLWFTYACLMNPLFPYGMTLVALLGLSEPLIQFRRRFAKPTALSPPL
jgi:Predicted membrane protein (DUF2232)